MKVPLAQVSARDSSSILPYCKHYFVLFQCVRICSHADLYQHLWIKARFFWFFKYHLSVDQILCWLTWCCSMEATEDNLLVPIAPLFIQHPGLRNSIQLNHWDLNTACSRVKAAAWSRKLKLNWNYSAAAINELSQGPWVTKELQQISLFLGGSTGYTQYPTNPKWHEASTGEPSPWLCGVRKRSGICSALPTPDTAVGQPRSSGCTGVWLFLSTEKRIKHMGKVRRAKQDLLHWYWGWHWLLAAGQWVPEAEKVFRWICRMKPTFSLVPSPVKFCTFGAEITSPRGLQKLCHKDFRLFQWLEN